MLGQRARILEHIDEQAFGNRELPAPAGQGKTRFDFVRDETPEDMRRHDDMQDLVPQIDRVIAASETPRETRSKLPSPYFFPLDNLTSILPKKNEDLACLRMLNRAVGGVMAVEAPSVAEALLQFYDRHGIKDLLSAYFDEPPCLSVKKWVLRRSKLPVSSSEWHQDGAFMGTDINSVNLWIPLTECGGETGAPGMDVVPRRLYEVGTAEGSVSNWTVCDELIDR